MPPISAPSTLRINLRILSIVVFNFASYLTIGLPLAILPSYVHDALGFSAFWAGVVISIQYVATLLSRPWAGRSADVLGPKKVVIFGLCGCFLSGLFYLLAAWGSGWPLLSLLLLCIGRLILGVGQSLAGTGSMLWGITVVGPAHIGRVISWSGVVTYGAMAIGAPFGVWMSGYGALWSVSISIMAIALVALLFALPRQGVEVAGGHKPLPFRAVLGRVWPYGLVLALASTGFGTIATFITLLYADHGWSGAAYSLTLFSVAFISIRLLFPNAIGRFGGLNVALLCFAMEICGLLLVWSATQPWMAQLGAFLTGVGFSLVFPSIGVEAVKQVTRQNQGSALATYTAFLDLSLGITGPLAGGLMTMAGIPIIYLVSAFATLLALLLTLQLRRRPQVEASD